MNSSSNRSSSSSSSSNNNNHNSNTGGGGSSSRRRRGRGSEGFQKAFGVQGFASPSLKSLNPNPEDLHPNNAKWFRD